MSIFVDVSSWDGHELTQFGEIEIRRDGGDAGNAVGNHAVRLDGDFIGYVEGCERQAGLWLLVRQAVDLVMAKGKRSDC